jgi:cell wall-associated NlpC family hydrolase
LIRNSLALTERNLTYRYGSSDPNSGGMDCSGTIYYLLKQSGIKEPPRDSSGLYLWAEKTGTLRSVNVKDLEDRALADLKPGDLLFWEGTYEVQRDPPISHTMIYLGRERKTGLRVMVGASDGRTYGGVSRNGVSVFDFRLPRAESTAKFVGYARVPGFDHSVRRRSVENQ